MAIGKVNAYATVQAPNVDFGDIALNAQKFQEADIEKQKEIKVAQMKAEKPEEFKANYIKSEEASGVASYESSQLDELNKANDEINIIEKEANKVGGYKFLPSELQVKYNNLQGLGKQIDSNKKIMVARFSKFQEAIPTFSKAMDGNLNFVAALMNEKAIHETGSDGVIRYRPFLLEDDGITRKYDKTTGKPLFATYTDRFGNVKETATKEEIESGSILNIPKAFDQLAFSKKVGDFVKPYKTGTDTGTVKQVWETLTPENKSTINSMIETEVINQRDNLIDVLYKLDPVKYKEPKKEYLEEDKEFARKGVLKSISGGIQLSNVKDVTPPPKGPGDDEKDKNPFRVTRGPNTLNPFYSKDLKDPNRNMAVWKKPLSLADNVRATDVNGKFVTINSGSIVTQGTFYKNGGALVKVGNLVSKSTTKKPSEADISFIKTKIDDGATDGELKVVAKSLGFEYETNWRVITKGVADQIIPGGVDSLKELLYSQKAPKTKTPAKAKANNVNVKPSR